jgi:hypothetical protein
MAYMSQEKKAKIAPVVKAILKKYNVKGSLSVRNHMTLCLTIKSGVIDFIGNYNSVVSAQPGGFRNGSAAEQSLDVNPYWYQDHFDGVAKKFLKEIFTAMNEGNWDKSDIQTDYFNVGWYVDVNIGRWNQPYILGN